jgi:hypothetical protein
MNQTKPNEHESIYQLKVTIKESEPPIWREIQVRSHITLYKLQRILQVVMGWGNTHLHQFTIDGTCYGQSHPEYGLEMKTERRARLDELVPEENASFLYEYNLDDSWMHHITVEKILEPTPGVHYPRCVAGDRACPPEECGGIRGYAEVLEILKNPEDPDYAETREWVDEDFDPEVFKIDEVNRQLKAIR